MERITYFAVARNSSDRVEQVFVERRDGKAYSQEFTGVIYKSDKEALADVGRLNQRLAHSILS